MRSEHRKHVSLAVVETSRCAAFVRQSRIPLPPAATDLADNLQFRPSISTPSEASIPTAVGSALVWNGPTDMDRTDGHDTTARDADHAQRGCASDASDPSDAASPAEREFVERVRRDRARARALVRRSIFVALVLAGAALFVARHGAPRPSGEHAADARSGGTADVPRQAPPAGANDEVLEQRVQRLEGRVGALEESATVLSRDVRPPAPTASGTRPSTSPASAVRAPRASRIAPAQRTEIKRPPVPVKRVAVREPLRETARPPKADADGITIHQRLRRGWETIERHVRRTPDELRDGLKTVKRLFGG